MDAAGGVPSSWSELERHPGSSGLLQGTRSCLCDTGTATQGRGCQILQEIIHQGHRPSWYSLHARPGKVSSPCQSLKYQGLALTLQQALCTREHVDKQCTAHHFPGIVIPSREQWTTWKNTSHGQNCLYGSLGWQPGLMISCA